MHVEFPLTPDTVTKLTTFLASGKYLHFKWVHSHPQACPRMCFAQFYQW